MAVSVCGCTCNHELDGSWLLVEAAAGCPLGHVGGERGWAEGAPVRVSGVGDCLTIVFERRSRAAVLELHPSAPDSRPS